MNDRNHVRPRRDDKDPDDAASGDGAQHVGGAAESSGDSRAGKPLNAPSAEPSSGAPRPVGPRRERYLVAPLAFPGSGHQGAAGGFSPVGMMSLGMMGASMMGPGSELTADALLASLHADPACTVHRVITGPVAGGSGGVSAFGAGPPLAPYPKVAVVEMEADRAAMFASAPLLHVEPDLPLQYAEPSPSSANTFADPGVIPLGDETTVSMLVLGGDGKPLEGAEVFLMSEIFPGRGVTGADGRISLSMPAGALRTLSGVYVKPRFDYWAVWLAHPELTLDAPNLVTCPAFAETFPGFPERQLDGWARKAMRFDALPPTFRGDGVKVAVIDSGAAIEHPDLSGRFAGGRDIPGQNDTGWQVDTVGHGSHTGAIIGGSDNGSGIVGVVPEAELHSCKIFPGGRFSDLIEAVDYCIANGIDVINLSLGSPQPSQLLARKIEQARQAGIACIVAAGNSGGPVAFPASMPSVLAVAAIGKTGEYPPETYHATQVWGTPTPDGYFSATFTCFGPEVDVCAPGVAVVSCVPPVNYAAWDGTSFAAPYVSGLAALLFAHHPDFRGRYGNRDSSRVDRLFELIRGSCRPLSLGDAGRSGAGLPDAVIALGLTGPVATTPPADPMLANLWAAMAQAGLVTSTMPTVPVGIGGFGGALPQFYAPHPAWTLPSPYGGSPVYSPIGFPLPAGFLTPAGFVPQAGFGTPAGYGPQSGYAGPAGLGVPAGFATPAGLGPQSGFPAPAGSVSDGPSADGAGSTAPSATVTAPATTTLTPSPGDSLSPLRAAMRAAGLLGQDQPGDPTD